MYEDALVVDGVAHFYSEHPDNYRDKERGPEMGRLSYEGYHKGFAFSGEDKWVMDRERFFGRPDPNLLADCMFAESQTDMAIYHSLPLYGLFNDGGSPMWVAKEVQKMYPGRMLIYGGLSPFMDGALEEIDRMVEEDGIIGIKFYPQDIIDGEIRNWRLDDEEFSFPMIERAREKGIRSIAVHKSQPLGAVHQEPFRVEDVDGAAAAFPDMEFQVVHGGFAFLEESAMQYACFPNVTINFENTSAFLGAAPRKFAWILGSFIAAGGPDRLIWATGATFFHPRPYLQAFMDLEFPEEWTEGWGIPPITDEIKKKIIGQNVIDLLGIDAAAHQAEFKDDRFSKMTEMQEPWTATPWDGEQPDFEAQSIFSGAKA